MSMLSAQIDELRALAGDGSMEYAAGPIRASVLYEAAETIEGLRERVQQIAILRDFAENKVDHNIAFTQKVEAENAELRELIRDLWKYIYIGTARDGQSLHDRTVHLGIEV